MAKKPKIQMTPDQIIKSRRSWVRIGVTYLAALFVFGGGLVLMWSGRSYTEQNKGGFDFAMDVFVTVLPIATGVITYWFATRGTDKQSETETPPVEDDSAKEVEGETRKDDDDEGGEENRTRTVPEVTHDETRRAGEEGPDDTTTRT